MKSDDHPDGIVDNRNERRNLEELYDTCWRIKSCADYYPVNDPRCDNFAYELLPERPPGHCSDYLTQNGVDYNITWYEVCRDWMDTYGISQTPSQSPSMKPTLGTSFF